MDFHPSPTNIKFHHVILLFNHIAVDLHEYIPKSKTKCDEIHANDMLGTWRWQKLPNKRLLIDRRRKKWLKKMRGQSKGAKTKKKESVPSIQTRGRFDTDDNLPVTFSLIETVFINQTIIEYYNFSNKNRKNIFMFDD